MALDIIATIVSGLAALGYADEIRRAFQPRGCIVAGAFLVAALAIVLGAIWT